MFRYQKPPFVARLRDLIDEILLGDFDYVVDGDTLYADVDYHHAAACGGRVREPTLRVEPERRAGAVPARDGVCTSPVRPLTAAGLRMSR